MSKCICAVVDFDELVKSQRMAAIKDTLSRCSSLLVGVDRAEMKLAIRRACIEAKVQTIHFLEWLCKQGLEWRQLAVSPETPEKLKPAYQADARFAATAVFAWAPIEIK